MCEERLNPLTLEMEEGPQAKACRQPLGVGKGKETDPPLELPEGKEGCPHLDFSPVSFVSHC